MRAAGESVPSGSEHAPSSGRRAFLCQAAALGLALRMGSAPAQDTDPREQRPAQGDRLVLADAASSSTPAPLKLADIPADAKKPVFAFPFDAATGTVRDGSKLNRVLLVRLAAADAAPATQGVVAFSAICTHEACTVSEWLPADQRLLCPCHFSKFDLRDNGAVAEGPAPRSLPSLPLRVETGGELVVDGGFSAQPGVRRST